jgi:hypothetical protein
MSIDPIDGYLRKLRRRWWWRRRRGRKLAEVEDHLRSAAEALHAAGRSADDAAHEAVIRFGTPMRAVARRWRRASVAAVSAVLVAGTTGVCLILLTQSSSETNAAAQTHGTVPFTAPIDLEGGAGSGLWGDTTSGPTGQHLGCLPGRRYAMAVTLRNRSASTVTVTAVDGSEPSRRIIRRVAVQIRLAPRAATNFPFMPTIRPWSKASLVPLAIPPGKRAVVQSNFLIGHCRDLRPSRAATINRAIVLTYRIRGHAGRQEISDPAARIIVTRGPTMQRCARPQGATRLIASDVTCTQAEGAAVACQTLPHETFGRCTSARRQWNCTYTSASKSLERCWLPSKRQSISVRWD